MNNKELEKKINDLDKKIDKVNEYYRKRLLELLDIIEIEMKNNV